MCRIYVEHVCRDSKSSNDAGVLADRESGTLQNRDIFVHYQKLRFHKAIAIND